VAGNVIHFNKVIVTTFSHLYSNEVVKGFGSPRLFVVGDANKLEMASNVVIS
jgi:putative NADH-flavin reductase